MSGIAERIVFADRELVVVDKPPGIVSCGPDKLIFGETTVRESLESQLIKHLGKHVWTVHQLDRNTSGLNCFVMKPSAVKRWNDRLKVPGTKRYLALVHGVPAFTETTVELPIGERWDGLKNFPAVVAADAPGAKAAKSRVRVIALGPGFAWVEVRTETGRMHQVRLHLAALGHPLVGEPLHRTPPCTLHSRHALHAARLDFQATPSLPALSLAAPLPADLVALSERLGVPLPSDAQP